jgi:Integrase core domain/GAG-pre-integrase domain
MEELKQYRPTASTVDEYFKREEQDKVFLLLASLTSKYEEVKRDILMRAELPSFITVCAIIQGEKTRKRVMNSDNKVLIPSNTETSALYLSSKTGWNKNKEKRTKFNCEHCHRDGHTKDRCWVLHPHLKPAKFKNTEAKTVVHTENSTAAVGKNFQTQLDHLNRQLQALMESHSKISETAGTSNSASAELVKAELNIGKCYALSSVHNSQIVVDTGATDNLFNSAQFLTNTSPTATYSQVIVANGTTIPTKGTGNTELFERKIDVVVVPDLKTNLLSISKCTNLWNCNVIFTPQKVVFQDRISGKKIGEGYLTDGLYVVNLKLSANAVTKTKSASPQVWHQCLGHPSDRVLHNLNMSLNFDSSCCDSCHFAKQHRLPFPVHSNKTCDLFELVHSDVWGNAPVESREGFKYFVTFIDDKSRATWLYLLKSKREVYAIFQEFCNIVRNQFNTTIKTLRTDNGTEYTNHEFQSYLKHMGISHQTSCVGTPQQNGIAERKNRHLLEVTRALLFSGNLPKNYWADAVLTGCYLINRLPSRVLDFKSPLEVLYNRKIDISHLRIVGCVCYVHSQDGGKLEPRSRKCVFLGYSSRKKGYICLDPNTKKIYIFLMM